MLFAWAMCVWVACVVDVTCISLFDAQVLLRQEYNDKGARQTICVQIRFPRIDGRMPATSSGRRSHKQYAIGGELQIPSSSPSPPAWHYVRPDRTVANDTTANTRSTNVCDGIVNTSIGRCGHTIIECTVNGGDPINNGHNHIAVVVFVPTEQYNCKTITFHLIRTVVHDTLLAVLIIFSILYRM